MWAIGLATMMSCFLSWPYLVDWLTPDRLTTLAFRYQLLSCCFLNCWHMKWCPSCSGSEFFLERKWISFSISLILVNLLSQNHRLHYWIICSYKVNRTSFFMQVYVTTIFFLVSSILLLLICRNAKKPRTVVILASPSNFSWDKFLW